MFLNLFSHAGTAHARAMTNQKASVVSASLPIPASSRPHGWLRKLLRLWRLYQNTPIGCEITASWIIDRSVGGKKAK